MQAQHMPFTKLINVDQGAREHFHIPKYQREYTWRRVQWEQLLNDIEDNDPGYFMGSIICVNDSQSLSPGDELIFEVIDGQQRLTTLSLLLAAIYEALKSASTAQGTLSDQDAEDVRNYLTNIRSKLVKRKRDGKANEPGSFLVGKDIFFLRVQPSAQAHNLEDYRYLLGLAGILDGQQKAMYCGNRLLGKAFAYFQDRISKDLTSLFRLISKINDLMFVQITVGSQSDAFTLFESLNNRGLPLSAMDIIKNKMLAQMERKHGVDIDESFTRWQSIIDAIPDAQDQERFLRHFYNANKHRKEIRVDKVSRATRSIIIRIFESLINRNASFVFDELTSAAETYGCLLRAEYKSKPLERNLTELERIGSTPVYQLLLYLFTLDGKHLEEDRFLVNVVDLMRRYFIRRNVTDTPPTRLIDQGLIDLIEACAARIKSGRVLEFDWFVEEFMKGLRPASIDEFKVALEGDIYENNIAMARYLLIQVDQMHHTREYQPDFWARDEKDRFIWTVEHVLPQAERLPEHWVQMIADGDKKAAAGLQIECVHRLGNLTLSGYNSDLATAPFEKKQKLSKDKNFLGQKINIGYRNGLALNALTFECQDEEHSLSSAPYWNPDLIEARTQTLVNMILEANLLPGERFGRKKG